MDKDVVIQIFGRKVKVVRNDNDYTCSGCALKDICNKLCGCNDDPCSTSDDSRQKFISVD